MYSASRATIPERQRGFTAIELLIVLALLAIFIALALPSFDGAIKRWRVSAAASEIGNALQFARAQAITTRQNIIVGQSNTTLLTGTGCAYASNRDWSCGISVYQNANTNNQQDNNEPAFKVISATDFKTLNV